MCFYNWSGNRGISRLCPARQRCKGDNRYAVVFLVTSRGQSQWCMTIRPCRLIERDNNVENILRKLFARKTFTRGSSFDVIIIGVVFCGLMVCRRAETKGIMTRLKGERRVRSFTFSLKNKNIFFFYL